MEESESEDYQNIVQCLSGCNGNVTQAQKIYFEKYGKDPSLEATLRAIKLHNDSNVLEKCVEDADSDILRITENESEKDVIIKEEIEIGEECFIKPLINKYNKYIISVEEPIPFVYTTRLDDMEIFKKNFESLTVEDIVSNVILESKPKLTKPLKDKTESITTYDTHPFFKLVEKIREFNDLHIVQDDEDYNVLSNLQDGDDDFYVLSTVNDDDSEDEGDNVPLKLLTPKKNNLNINRKVKVVKRKCQTKEKKTQVVNQCKPCTIPLTPSLRMSLIKGTPYVIYDKDRNEPVTFLKGVLYKITFGSYIEFTNHKTKSREIYVFDKKGLFSKTINSYDELDSQFTNWYSGRMTYCLKVNECCWFQREHVLNSLIWPKNINEKAVFARFSILRKPHSCPSGQCNCCCKLNTIEDEIEEVPIVDVIEASAETVACQVVRSFIDYKNKTERKYEMSSDNNAETAEDLIKAKDRLGIQILKNYSNLTEFYELRSNGNVLKHIEIKSKYLRTSHNFRTKMKLNADSDKEFCCWRKRDALLSTYEFRYSMITQFIRTPHPCTPGHCICCCKPNLPKTFLTVKDLTTLKYAPKHAYNYTNISKQRRKFLAKPKNMKVSEIENVKSDLLGKISAKPPNQYKLKNNLDDSELICNQSIDYESFISGEIIDKTIDSILIEKNDLQKSHIRNKGVPSQKVSRNRIIGQKKYVSIAPKKATQGRLVKKSSTITQNLNKTLKASVAYPPTQPQQLASQPQVPSSLLPTLQQLRPPLGSQPPGLSRLEQNTIAPAQSNVAFPANSSPVLNPLTNIIPDDAQGPTVNSLVQSILQRFNDVRLIITPDGDVSAELSTPIQDLTTSELQILSKILMHAREQVKVLKAAGHLNSGKNTVFNPWPSNPVINSNLIQTPVVNTAPVMIQTTPTAPVVIANADSTASATQTTASSSNVFTSSKTMINKENEACKTRNSAFQCYTNLSALKMKEYLTSCRSYLNIKFSPKIEKVFSLNQNASKKPETISKNTNNSDNSTTLGVKRKVNQIGGYTKKLKTMELPQTIELDASEAEIPLQPNVSTIPITTPANVMSTPNFPGVFNTPYAVPTGASPVINPNLMYVAVPVTLPSGLPPVVRPPIVGPPIVGPSMVGPPMVLPYMTLSQYKDPRSNTPTNEDDCILGF